MNDIELIDEIVKRAEEHQKQREKEFAIAELEKIKADFEEIKGQRDNPYNNKTEYSVSMKELREVFDKHISELKGENDESI